MLISSIILVKIASPIIKEMLNFHIVTSLGSNLFSVGNQYIRNSIENHLRSYHAQQTLRSGSSSKQAIDNATQDSTEYLVLNWLEALFAWFQIVILWHDPILSICAISGFFASFLLLTYLAPRFYATIMIAIFTYNLIKVWFRHVWPEIRVPPEVDSEEEKRLDVDRWTYLHPHILTLAQVGRLTSNLMKLSEIYLQKLLKLRREDPKAFCIAICSTLSITAYLGNKICGISLLFGFFSIIVLSPGIYLYLLPQFVKDFLWQNIGLKFVESIQEQIDETSSGSSLLLESSPPSKSSVQTLIKLLKQYSLKFSTDSTNKLPRDNDINEDIIVTEESSKRKSSFQEYDIDNEAKTGNTNLKLESTQMGSSEISNINDSQTIIDWDDEQHDGFVLL